MQDRMNVFGMNMARRSRRRWLVAATYVCLLVVTVLAWTQGANAPVLLLVLATLVNGIVFGGYGRGGLIKPFLLRGSRQAPARWNDERDLRRRDRVHFHAYRFVVAILILGFVLASDPFRQPQLGRALVMGGMLLGLTLPQALLLWIEPDMDFDDALHGAVGP